MTNRFQSAIDVQDAGNLRAIARSFVEVVDAAQAETKSTTATWEDPAVRLFAAKIQELCGLGYAEPDRFGAAYVACHRRARNDERAQI